MCNFNLFKFEIIIFIHLRSDLASIPIYFFMQEFSSIIGWSTSSSLISAASIAYRCYNTYVAASVLKNAIAMRSLWAAPWLGRYFSANELLKIYFYSENFPRLFRHHFEIQLKQFLLSKICFYQWYEIYIDIYKGIKICTEKKIWLH